VVKKDVAPGQNFSRFNPLTKITVFWLIRNPMIGAPQGTQLELRQAKVQIVSKGGLKPVRVNELDFLE
jgi:hypothetical protein